MKYLLSLFIVVAAHSVQAQTPLDRLEKEFIDYSQLLVDGDYASALDYAPKNMFAIVPRNTMIAVMDSMLNSDDFKLLLHLPVFTESDKAFTDDKVTYQVFYYKQRLGINFETEASEDIADEDSDLTNELRLNLLNATYGDGSVTYDSIAKWYDINIIKKALAIQYEEASHLHFAVLEDNQTALLEKLFSKSVLKKINQ
jgi:hypothetical protein